MFCVTPRFFGRSRNSNRCFGSYRKFVDVPENLESVFCVTPRFFGRSRNIDVSRHTENLWTFQEIWNRCFASHRDFLVVPEIQIGVLGHTENLWTFQKIWNRCFALQRDFVDVPEILESFFWVTQKICGRSRKSGIGVLRHTEILWMFQKFWICCFTLGQSVVACQLFHDCISVLNQALSSPAATHPAIVS